MDRNERGGGGGDYWKPRWRRGECWQGSKTLSTLLLFLLSPRPTDATPWRRSLVTVIFFRVVLNFCVSEHWISTTEGASTFAASPWQVGLGKRRTGCADGTLRYL